MKLTFLVRSTLVTLCLAALPLFAATYTVTNANDSGPGSLRQALLDADQPPGGHRIEFAIGSGPQSIQPLTNLPSVGKRVVIDGRTQPGYSGKPIIEIDGWLIGGESGTSLGLDLSDADVYGLVVNHFQSGTGIRIAKGSIRNCYIGMDVSGTDPRRNEVGIRTVQGGPVVIGGAGATDGNLISANGTGVNAGANTTMAGNWFGTNAAGTAVLGSTTRHVIVENQTSGNVTIGGPAPNVFAGGTRGVLVLNSSGVHVTVNYFGRTPAGRTFRINYAIDIDQSSDNLIDGNFIRGNDLAVLVQGSSLRNRILANSLDDNSYGIDLSPYYYYWYGPTRNDETDTDLGPNNLMNYPVVSGVTTSGGQTTITGTLTTHPNRSHRVELFSSPDCNRYGAGEGRNLLEHFDLVTDGSGVATFSRTVPAVPFGHAITATATSELEGTSEFSPCKTVEGPGRFVFDTGSTTRYEGGSEYITVRRLDGTRGAASVMYSVSGGTATAADFTGGSGTLHFADGESAKSFRIDTTEDSIYEGDETILLALRNPMGGTSLGTPSAMTLRIDDDDSPPSAALHNDVDVQEGTGGAKIVQVPITLSFPTVVPYVVEYTVGPYGSATPGEDFIPPSGSVTFAPGETAKSIPITILGDAVWEQDESLRIELSSSWWEHATVFIRNDDPVPTVTVETLRVAEGNGKSTALVTFRASQLASGSMYVRLAGATAQPATDFTQRAGWVSFSKDMTATFAVGILGDTEPEPDESFTVEIVHHDLSLDVVDRTGIVTILNDDAGVGPAERWIPTGDSREFTVRLAQRLTEDVTIGLASDAPSAISLPTALVIPAGQLSGNFAVKALQPGEKAGITLSFPPSLGGGTRSVRVRTYTKTTPRFSPERLTVIDGKTATVTVSLDPPAATATTLGLRSTDAAKVPSSLTIPPGGSASFVVTAVRIGSFTVTVQLPPIHGNELHSLYGEVVEVPKTPAMFSITPSHGPASGGTEVAIEGLNLRNDCTVAFGGAPATSVRFVSATAMTAVTPPHAGGNVDVTLACGSDSFVFANGFGYVSETPRVSSVRPSQGTIAGGTHVRVEGEHFDGSCWLFFGSAAATDVVVRDPRSITGITPPRAASVSDVTVRCSAGTSTLAAAFTYRGEDDPAPLITELVPAAAAPGELVTIRGLNFRPTDTAAIDTASAAIVDPSPESHVVRVPELPAGAASVSVTDLLGRMTTSGPLFSVLEARPPRIAALAPASVAAGAELELTGEGFRDGYTFAIGGETATIVALDFTRAVVRVSPHVAAGSHPVHVHNRDGVLATIGPNVAIAGAGIVVNSVEPRCTTTDGGVYATIRGSGFASSLTVTFDGVPATEIAVVDAATLRVLVPHGAAGPATISVSGSTLTDGFRYVSPFDPRGCGSRGRIVRR